MADAWTYARECMGKSDWWYVIYRHNVYWATTDYEHKAMILCNALNRDERG